MKNILFPHVFKAIGWCLFIPALSAGALIFLGILQLSGLTETVVNDLVILGITIGSLFIVCSKESVEDEMTRSIRLASLLNSLYINVSLLVICTLTMHGLQFLRFAVLNLVLLPVIFVFTFRMEMQRYNRMCENEE